MGGDVMSWIARNEAATTGSQKSLRRYSGILVTSIVVLGAYFWAHESAFYSGAISTIIFGSNSVGSLLDASYLSLSTILYVFADISAFRVNGKTLAILVLSLISILLYFAVPSAIVLFMGYDPADNIKISIDSSIRLVVIGLLSYLSMAVRALIKRAHGENGEGSK